jgi:arsenate reductase (thioredoxin)
MILPLKPKVLFLCTGNSARSVFGEYLLRVAAPLRFETFSAGARPSGRVHPMTLRVLKEFFHTDASGARSKSWDELKDMPFNFVITVCDNARESCPIWPGQPVIAHWGSPDPAAFTGTEEEQFRFFRDVALQIYRRCQFFAALPMEKLDRLRLDQQMRDIGQKETFTTDVSPA